MKLKCYELKEILKNHGLYYGYEVFKSGKDVEIRIYFDENEILNFIRGMNFSVIPDTIPTDGYYTVEW